MYHENGMRTFDHWTIDHRAIDHRAIDHRSIDPHFTVKTHKPFTFEHLCDIIAIMQ